MAASTIRAGRDLFQKNLGVAQAGGSVGARNIKWDDFNYPPILRVMHYDISELDGPSKAVVRWAHWAYLTLLAGLLTNFLINLVLVAASVPMKGLHVVYSLFNVLILGGVGLYGEYAAFKGVAKASSAKMRRYMLLQLALTILSVLFSILKVANWNGWMRLEEAAALRAPIAPFWFWATVVEAAVWSGCAVLGCIAIYNVYELERNGPLAFSAKASRGAKDAASKGAKAARSMGDIGSRI